MIGLQSLERSDCRSSWYLWLLAGGKALKVGGVFFAADLLQSLHVCQLLFFLKLIPSAAAFLLIQKSLSIGGLNAAQVHSFTFIQLEFRML